MTDVTAGRSAGTPRNADVDPMGRADTENRRPASGGLGLERRERDLTAGRSAETTANTEQDPTAGQSAGTTANAVGDPTRSLFHQPRR